MRYPESLIDPLHDQKKAVEEWTDYLFVDSPSIEMLESDISKFKVNGAPPTLHYIPDFISKEGERRLIETIESVPHDKWGYKQFHKQDWGQVYYPDGRLRSDGGEMTPWAIAVFDRITSLQRTSVDNDQPKSLRVNKYEPGLGASELYSTDEAHAKNLICSVYLEPRSLFFFSGTAFDTFWHGVQRVKEDLITDKVLNFPDGMKVGDFVPRGIRYAIVSKGYW